MRPYPPLATLLAAAVLRERGYDVALFYAMLAPGVEAFADALDRHRPVVVALLEDNFNFLTKMCTVRMRQDGLTMVQMARSRGCGVLVNGSDAADHPERYLAAGADAVIAGEPERTLVETLERWQRNQDTSLTDIAGLALLDDRGVVTRTAARPAMRHLDHIPMPAWDLVDASAYRSAWRAAHGRFSWNMVTSRGCPFHCNWCAKPIFGQRYAQRAPELVAAEMRLLKEHIAPDHVWFADDIFGVTPDWIHRFARAVTAQDARIPFMIQSRVDLLTPDIVDALATAGAEDVWMGVESGSQRILDAMDKGSTIEEARAATRTLKARGVRACWFIQLGYPTETWVELLLTRDAIREEQPNDIGVSVAYPLPNTKFYERVRAQLGARQNWDDTGDLAMLFHGTYSTDFYRKVRHALHDELASGVVDDERWVRLEQEAAAALRDRPIPQVVA